MLLCNEHWDNPNDSTNSDILTPDASFYTTANIFSKVGTETSLMGDIHERKTTLQSENYMDDTREHVEFINSYVRISSDISNILKIKSTDDTQTRLLFVSENRAQLDAIVAKLADGQQLDDTDNNTLKAIATAYKYEGVTALDESKLVDIYNVLNYICEA